jgi:hypothetical protein
VEILKDKYGRSRELIREIAGGQERLFDIGTRLALTGRRRTLPATITVPRIGSRNSMPGWAAKKSKFLGVFLYCRNQKEGTKQGEISARIYIVTRYNSTY